MGNVTEVRHPSRLRTLYYWIALFAILTVLDDLSFGWIFWALAQVSPFLSAGVAFAIYWSIGIWLVFCGLRDDPGRIAGWFLNRFQLERKDPELRAREDQLKRRISSIAWAVPMSLLFGGVITSLWLFRRGVVDRQGARRIGILLCGIYAIEFALIHGFGIGGSIFFVRQ